MKKGIPFGEFIKSQKTVEVTPTLLQKSTRPQPGIQSRIVILRKRADGSLEEKSGAPPFLMRLPEN